MTELKRGSAGFGNSQFVDAERCALLLCWQESCWPASANLQHRRTGQRLLNRTWGHAWSFQAKCSLFTKDPRPEELESSTRQQTVGPSWQSIHSRIRGMKSPRPI